MLSRRQIERMVAAGTHRRMVERILANGRCGSEAARARLTDPRAATAAGLGLALQRLCELSYSPSEGCREVSRRLMRLQRPHGLFGPTEEGSIPGSAAAVRGLHDWCGLLHEGDPDRRRVEGAMKAGLRGLLGAIDGGGQRAPDVAELAIMVWQLGPISGFRRVIPAFLITVGADAAGQSEREDDLFRMARAAAA